MKEEPTLKPSGDESALKLENALKRVKELEDEVGHHKEQLKFYKNIYDFDERELNRLWVTLHDGEEGIPVSDTGNSYNTTPVIVNYVIDRIENLNSWGRMALVASIATAIICLCAGLIVGVLI